MDLSELINYIISQLGALGDAAFAFVKVLLAIFIQIFEFLADLIRRGLESWG